MSVNVIATDKFQRKAKKLIKKYKSLRGEILELIEVLESNPQMLG